MPWVIFKVKLFFMPATGQPSAQVFISYSHKDKEWLDRLNVHLAPIKRNHSIVIWDDTTLRPGMQWDEEIKKALSSVQAAILLLSADFLASEYINNEELPTILEAAANKGATILSLVISPCLLSSVPKLAAIQTVNNPKSPLINLRSGKREEVFVQLAEQVAALLNQQSAAMPATVPAKNAVKRSGSKSGDAEESQVGSEDESFKKPVKKAAGRSNMKGYTEQIRQQLHLFNDNSTPNRFLVVSFEEVYMQYLKSDDGEAILFEAVSNKFLPREMKLSAGQMKELVEAGFNEPDENSPNFSLECSLPDEQSVKELAAFTADVLFTIYRLPQGANLYFEQGNTS